nr:response regulator transcription factor [Ornithinimicrobium sp. F0845]
MLRQGLQLVLEHAGHEVVAAAEDAPSVVALTEEHRPDLVVTDIRMPPGFTDEGLVAALTISREHADTAIVVLSQHVQRRYVTELLAERPAGIGYLLKQRIADIDTFSADLERVRAGGTVLDPEVVALLVARARRDDTGGQHLTPRQEEVLALMAQGRSNSWIARHLTLTEKAVVQHTSHIYSALGLPPRDDDHRRVLAVLHHLTR